LQVFVCSKALPYELATVVLFGGGKQGLDCGYDRVTAGLPGC